MAKESAANAIPKSEKQVLSVENKPTGVMVIKKKENENELGKDEKKVVEKKSDGKKKQ